MLNPLDMTGKTILVTGASSGIGRATAVLLSQLGARVILVARSADNLEQTYQLLSGSGHAIEAYDLAEYEHIPTWIRAVVSRHGGLDGLVHSAGIQITAPLKVLDARRVEQLWRINVSASLWLAKGFRQKGVNNQGGSIVFLSSAIALIAGTGLAAYSASKGAVIALVRSLAVELAREHIRVNCVAPGLVKTEMFHEFAAQMPPDTLAALERGYLLGFGETSDVSHSIVFLLAGASRWITGSTLVVDGGLTVQ